MYTRRGYRQIVIIIITFAKEVISLVTLVSLFVRWLAGEVKNVMNKLLGNLRYQIKEGFIIFFPLLPSSVLNVVWLKKNRNKDFAK